jgi:hypothetical protein
MEQCSNRNLSLKIVVDQLTLEPANAAMDSIRRLMELVEHVMLTAANVLVLQRRNVHRDV